MKKFILEFSALLALVFLTGLLLYRIDIPSPIARKIHAFDKTKFEIINLGTSHGGNFDYSESALHGESFNREGNTLFYDLQNYIYLNKNKFLSKDAIVIIPVSYYVFGLDENRTDRPNDSFVNDFYYYLPKEQIFSYSEQKRRNLRGKPPSGKRFGLA